MHGVLAVHGHEVQITKAFAIQFGIHLCSVLMIMASYEWALLGL